MSLLHFKAKKENKTRTRDDFGKHPNDFEHRCKWRDQIIDIGEGTKRGDGEEVTVRMQSGRIALYKLYSEDADGITADSTGLRHWHYHFIKYQPNPTEETKPS